MLGSFVCRCKTWKHALSPLKALRDLSSTHVSKSESSIHMLQGGEAKNVKQGIPSFYSSLNCWRRDGGPIREKHARCKHFQGWGTGSNSNPNRKEHESHHKTAPPPGVIKSFPQGWIDSSVLSTYCFCKRPKFYSQHPC